MMASTSWCHKWYFNVIVKKWCNDVKAYQGLRSTIKNKIFTDFCYTFPDINIFITKTQVLQAMASAWTSTDWSRRKREVNLFLWVRQTILSTVYKVAQAQTLLFRVIIGDLNQIVKTAELAKFLLNHSQGVTRVESPASIWMWQSQLINLRLFPEEKCLGMFTKRVVNLWPTLLQATTLTRTRRPKPVPKDTKRKR